MKKLMSILLILALLLACSAGALAEDQWTDFHCEEDKFTTRKPMYALTEYKNDKGYVGITFYLNIPGYAPYVMVHRRPVEGKFKNPKNYLNNTYREFLEEKYAGDGIALNPARVWEIDDKQLIGAKYDIGGMIQIQLIEQRDLGDVEYTAVYFDAADEEATMEALEAAVTFYIEDDASDAARAIIQAKTAVQALNAVTEKNKAEAQTKKDDQPREDAPAKTETQSKDDMPGGNDKEPAEEDPFANRTFETGQQEAMYRARYAMSRFFERFSEDLSKYDAQAMELLNRAGAGTEIQTGTADSGLIDAWMNAEWMQEDWMDDEWKKEHIAYWMEEREKAKKFIARFSETLSEEDLLTFTLLYDDGYHYVLGKTTPKDLMENGWSLGLEGDGTFSLSDRNGNFTGIYLRTERGYFDEPILTVDAMGEEGLMMDYCGFDGAVGIYAEDPDEYWYPDETGMKLSEVFSETGECIDLWDGLVNWLVTDCGAKQSEEGIWETKIALNGGRTLYVSSHDSQVRISLVGFY